MTLIRAFHSVEMASESLIMVRLRLSKLRCKVPRIVEKVKSPSLLLAVSCDLFAGVSARRSLQFSAPGLLPQLYHALTCRQPDGLRG